jgi:hypothetical protein
MPGVKLLRELTPHAAELGLIIGFYLIYLITRGLFYSQLDEAGLQNALRVVSLERGLGMYWEPAWQAWMLGRAEALVVVLNWVYIITYWPVVLGVGLVLFIRNRPRFYYYRTVVAVSLVFALVVFALFPVSPPFGMTAQFINTIQVLGPSLYGGPEMAPTYNPDAAMPSLHFSWTLVLGVLFVRRLRGRAKLLGALYPAMTFLAITITGNHFILDAVAGGLLAGVAFVIVELGFRKRFSLSR